jgi:hypothetical protein
MCIILDDLIFENGKYEFNNSQYLLKGVYHGSGTRAFSRDVKNFDIQLYFVKLWCQTRMLKYENKVSKL